MDSNQSRAVGGTIWVHFRVHWPIWGLWTAPKPNSSHSGADFDLSWPPANSVNSNGPKWLVQVSHKYYYIHISYSTCTYWGHFRRYSGEVVFVATAVQILKILLLGHFLQMFCMKCVLCINISRPEAKEYGYITYWLISSKIANCFELTATLSYCSLLSDANSSQMILFSFTKINKSWCCLIIVFTCNNRLEISTFAYFASTFAL